MFDVKSAVVPDSVVFDPLVVGFIETLQQIPRAVIALPPSVIRLPPHVAVVFVILVTGVLVLIDDVPDAVPV